MQRFPYSLPHANAEPSNLAVQACACLQAGGVVLLPTDTVYGLAVCPLHEHAIDKLYALKQRPRARALPIMVANAQQVLDLGAIWNETAEHLAVESPWVPGALSLVVGLEIAQAPGWLVGRQEIAFRVPNEPLLLSILAASGPLLVTSANQHGKAPLTETDTILAQLAGKPDMVIEQQQQQKSEAPLSSEPLPSTLVNCRLSPPKIERQGAVAKADLEAFLGGPLE